MIFRKNEDLRAYFYAYFMPSLISEQVAVSYRAYYIKGHNGQLLGTHH